MVNFVRSFHTNQPYTAFCVYNVDGHEVIVQLGHGAQTWDCQPCYIPSQIIQVDGADPRGRSDLQEIIDAIVGAYPDSTKLQELTIA